MENGGIYGTNQSENEKDRTWDGSAAYRLRVEERGPFQTADHDREHRRWQPSGKRASTGPVIGHCSPEAQAGGPIALVEEGDLIELDVFARKLNIIGIRGEKKTPEEVELELAKRRAAWQPKSGKYKSGVLRLFSELAASPMKGAYLDYSRFEK